MPFVTKILAVACEGLYKYEYSTIPYSVVVIHNHAFIGQV